MFQTNVDGTIAICKRFNIDYKVIIHEKFGNETELENGFLKFFKIE